MTVDVVRRIEEQASSRPDAVAVEFEGSALTYEELDERSSRLAQHLIRRGAGPEVLVGLCVDRSLELVVGVLGILKAGAAFLPLDPGYPADRLAFMVDDSAVGLVLSRRHLDGSLPSSVTEVVDLDDLS
ncbi:MAG TPA: AMP-binding protein, partial [Acidimicrobiales bacterium]|nr:AMP-binding protein [Acidimicrobiales bacterium]